MILAWAGNDSTLLVTMRPITMVTGIRTAGQRDSALDRATAATMAMETIVGVQ
jgi:hypothetical protein